MQKEKVETFEISIQDLIAVFKKNFKIFALSYAFFFVLVAVIFAFFITPTYLVNSLIEIRTDVKKGINFDPTSLVIGSGASSNSLKELEVFKSRSILNSVIKKSKLCFSIKKSNNTMFMFYFNALFRRSNIEGAVFAEQYPDGLYSGKIIANDKDYELKAGGEKVRCNWKEECKLKTGILILNKVGRINDGMSYDFSVLNSIDAREMLASKISINEVDDSSLLRISMENENPFLASKVLKDILKNYTKLKDDWNSEDISIKKEYIKNILKELDEKIQKKGQSVINYQKEQDTLLPKIQAETIIRKKEILEKELEVEEIRRKMISKTIEDVKNSANTPVAIPMLFEDTSFQKMLTDHNNLIAERNSLLKKLTEEHPLIFQADEKIKNSSKSLTDMLTITMKTVDYRIDNMNKALRKLLVNKKKVPEQMLIFGQLERDLMLAEKVYLALSTKLYETSIDKSTGIKPVRVIDEPDSVVKKHSPRTAFFAAFLLLGSLIFAVLVVLLFYFFSNDEKNVESKV